MAKASEKRSYSQPPSQAVMRRSSILAVVVDAAFELDRHLGLKAWARGAVVASQTSLWLRQASTANNKFVRSRLRRGPRLAAARGIVARRTTSR